MNAVVTLWFSLFFREAPLDRKHAGCSRRRLRVEKSFIREREVIPSIQKKTPKKHFLPFHFPVWFSWKGTILYSRVVCTCGTGRTTNTRCLNIHWRTSRLNDAVELEEMSCLDTLLLRSQVLKFYYKSVNTQKTTLTIWHFRVSTDYISCILFTWKLWL